jgi:hypothetical protein
MAGIQDLQCSHDELRAALIIAGKRIRQFQFGRKDDSVLVKLRDVLREARTVRRVSLSNPRHNDGCRGALKACGRDKSPRWSAETASQFSND